jgi:putative Holliday junction resolvase
VSDEHPAGAGTGAAGSVLALDLGAARIGVAVSDPDRRVAIPLGTVRTGAPQDLKAIAALVRDHTVSLVVVGDPVNLSGAPSESSRHAAAFAEALRSVLSVPVELYDERLSTVEAERQLAEAGVRGRRRREVVDQVAATVILRSYLDRAG